MSCALHPIFFAVTDIAVSLWNVVHREALGAGDVCLIRLTAFLYLGCAAVPLLAQNPGGGAVPAQQGASTTPAKGMSPAPADPQAPIIGDEEFDAAVPALDDTPLESIEAWQAAQEAKEEGGTAQQQAAQTAADPVIAAVQDGDVVEILPDPPVTDPLLDDPLPPIDSFDAEPPPEPTQVAEREARALRYIVRVDGLDATKTTDIAKDADGVAVEAGDVLLNITGDSVARVCQAPAFVLPARVNQHVGIYCHTNREYDTGNTRQGQSCTKHRQHG